MPPFNTNLVDPSPSPLVTSPFPNVNAMFLPIPGKNSLVEDESVWVVSMGHLMGLHDNPWFNIPPTRRMGFVRYCEWNQVKGGKIVHQALWVDIPHFMVQAGVNPFPPQTGAEMVRPGMCVSLWNLL